VKCPVGTYNPDKGIAMLWKNHFFLWLHTFEFATW
jgi:hypothetical protein